MARLAVQTLRSLCDGDNHAQAFYSEVKVDIQRLKLAEPDAKSPHRKWPPSRIDQNAALHHPQIPKGYRRISNNELFKHVINNKKHVLHGLLPPMSEL